MKSSTEHSFKARSGSVVTGGPTNAMRIEGFTALIASARRWSPSHPTVEVNSTRNSYSLQIRIVSSAETWCGGASSRREPSSMPAGYVSQTGYQYDSISRVAGQRELAPPSKFSNEGGFKNSVFNGINISFYRNIRCSEQQPETGAATPLSNAIPPMLSS